MYELKTLQIKKIIIKTTFTSMKSTLINERFTVK